MQKRQQTERLKYSRSIDEIEKEDLSRDKSIKLTVAAHIAQHRSWWLYTSYNLFSCKHVMNAVGAIHDAIKAWCPNALLSAQCSLWHRTSGYRVHFRCPGTADNNQREALLNNGSRIVNGTIARAEVILKRKTGFWYNRVQVRKDYWLLKIYQIMQEILLIY